MKIREPFGAAVRSIRINFRESEDGVCRATGQEFIRVLGTDRRMSRRAFRSSMRNTRKSRRPRESRCRKSAGRERLSALFELAPPAKAVRCFSFSFSTPFPTSLPTNAQTREQIFASDFNLILLAACAQRVLCYRRVHPTITQLSRHLQRRARLLLSLSLAHSLPQQIETQSLGR